MPIARFCCLCAIILCGALLAACGGGGGSGDTGSGDIQIPGTGSPDRTEAGPFTITAIAGEGGSISPGSRQVESGSLASFTITPDEGHTIAAVTGCDGSLSENLYTTGPVTGDCSVTATFSAAEAFVGGTVAGLQGQLGLQLESAEVTEQIAVEGGGDGAVEFVFDTPLLLGTAYEITILTQPTGQRCTLQNGFGEVDQQSVDAVQIICVAETAAVTLSGTIVPTANIDVDWDLNDPAAFFTDNSTLSLAQPIGTRTTLHGFASETATGGDPTQHRFASTTDRNDYYRAQLQQGQVVQLRVVDHEDYNNGQSTTGDLDLHLLSTEGELAGISNDVVGLEEVVVPQSGDYFIRVHAWSGISKYVLRLLPSAGLGSASGDATPLDFVPYQMVVKRNESRTGAAAASALTVQTAEPGRATLVELPQPGSVTALAAGVAGAMPNLSALELQKLNAATFAKLQTLQSIKQARLQPDVVYAEPNFIRRAYVVPNDPAYQYQWHYAAIGLPQAWDLTTASGPDAPVVAVIDTGVFLAHPDLQPQLVDGYDFISNADRAGDADGLDNNPDDPGDSEVLGQSSWHGTHVAGTIAAATGNDAGVAGVAWGAKIMPLRVLGAGGATSYDVVQALRYAAGLPNDSNEVPTRTADIVNLSLGGPGASLAEQEAYREVRDSGVIIVAAAGNESSSVPSYPAAYDGVISVSATDFVGDRAPYSNFGESIDVAAPGGNMAVDLSGDGYPDGVLSTLVDDTSGTREPAVSFYHGTSMAAPHVAGVLALMKAVYPELTPAQVDSLLQSGALTDDFGEPGWDPVYGYGHIDASKAVEVAQNLAAGAPPPETSAHITVLPQIVNMNLAESATVTVSNEGGGDPAVTDVSSSAGWLTVAPEGVNDEGLGNYRLLVDRTGLADGPHQGSVTFSSDTGGTAAVQVHIQVGTQSTTGQLTQLYVLLLDAETEAVIASVPAVGEGTSAAYAFEGVPAGEYKIIAGSDVDADGVICQAGESCGAFPTLNRSQTIAVPGQDVNQLDFVADVLGAIPASSDAEALRAKR